MTARAFMFLLLAGMLSLPVRAQTNAAQTESASQPNTNAAPTLTDAQVAAYHQRFEEGKAQEKAGNLAQARATFDGILAEQPDAKGSLLEAGEISLELNEPAKADAYLDKLHAIVPDFPGAIELLIQANETLRHEVKAARLVRELRTLHDGSSEPKLSALLKFDRERIRLDAGEEIVISEFFDYTQPPYNAFMAELSDPVRQIDRRVYLNFDPVGTQTVRAKDPKLARDEVFLLAEPIYTGNKMTRVDVYQALLAMPDYDKLRTMLLVALTETPKPIYSSPVDASAQSATP
jgi:tetratricopeptide (TPR) repeat protein